MRCRRKFLRYFPRGFHDPKYVSWERAYKVAAHEIWQRELNRRAFAQLLNIGDHLGAAREAVKIEGRTSLLFSFEKMALRDAVKSEEGARLFSNGLYDFLHGNRDFDRWCSVVATLPRVQTRVLTWPIATIFGFLAQPDRHVYLKPNVTRRAAEAYGYDFAYESTPNAQTYAQLLDFAATVRKDLGDLEPRDQIDAQSFIWVMGSDEYP